MSVNGVNNNSNAELYALGAAAVGAGAGAGAAYLTKPFLKDGAPTDEFIKKMDDNYVKNNPEAIKIKEKFSNLTNKLKEIKDTKELNNFIKNNNIIIPKDGLINIDINKAANIDEAKTLVQCCIDADLDAELAKTRSKFDAEAAYKEFANNKSKMNEAIKTIVEKSKKSIQSKYAMIYGGIAAAVLGIGTYLATSGKKEAPAEKVDTQA